jgi:hypothetical protein
MSLLSVEPLRLIIFGRLILTILVFTYLLPRVANCIIHLPKELFSLPLLSIFTSMLFFSPSFIRVISQLPYDPALFQAISANHSLAYK